MADHYQVLLDVKLDLKERKHELWQLRNWVNCVVSIQAIKCFPCYLKISFYHKDDGQLDDHPFSVIRINIPGIKLENAASRTKNHTYGVFWKNNRKKCKMFFAFDQRSDCVSHMEWLKSRIDSLEIYRKDILDNHRISRSYTNKISKVKVPSAGACSLNNSQYEDIERHTIDSNAECGRDLQDVLGPLPALPVMNDECSGRWSIRRTSGFSGIYEEILDGDDEGEQKPRTSITSGIYVAMATPTDMHLSEHYFETPPPLPPRRRLKHSNTNPDLDEIKHKRSAWNIIDNMFGRNKKSATLTRIPSTNSTSRINHSNQLHFDSLCNKLNSFSTPDLTNMAEAVTSNYNIIDIDDNDLEIMDIERSNSLNSAANQFLCRPPALNISSNILWSHNLSSNLSTIGDSSSVNLVGANVNTDQFLNDEQSGYCKMVSTSNSWKEESFNVSKPLSATNSNGFELSTNGCRVIEHLSGYCEMAPIINQKDSFKKPQDIQVKNKIIAQDIVVSSKRASYHDDDNSSLLDFSLISNGKHSSSRGSCHDENSSSGVSSDEGAIYVQNLRTAALDKVKSTLKLDIEHDDAISITCTESPTSPMAISATEFTQSKQKINFDDKYPSYYPNSNIYSSPIDIKKPSNSHGTHTQKSPLHNLNICCPNTRKTATVKTFTKNPMKKHSNKKSKPDDNSILRERIGNEENSPLTNDSIKMQKFKLKTKSTTRTTAQYPHLITGDRISPDTKNIANKYHSKTKASIEMEMVTIRTPSKIDEVNGISTLPHTKSNSGKKYNNFGTLPKTPATPKHIYRKCAFANRITSPSPPSTPSHSSPSSSSSNDVYLVSPLSSPGQETSDLGNSSMNYKYTTETMQQHQHHQHTNGSSKGSDIAGSILRFARFRKIDFSPLRVKFTNILQRQSSEV